MNEERQKPEIGGGEIAPDVVDAIRGTHLDYDAYITDLRSASETDQRSRVAYDLEHPRQHLPPLKNAWALATDEEREDFLQWDEFKQWSAD